ncbi:Conidiation protein 6-domain-containing protein [Tricharina praecox]|uniref:Conidiation protein 6-domain-containing protein n=1 Tax=Tricharina praecox TaxID=43433 RepID=UPI002220CDEF|nr:Conidiation protein 6-domain-containing protein [Tricharina praecox]KAI5844086.1 Conidiation protein 6-domain-containing protein [Tricharina praecox]
MSRLVQSLIPAATNAIRSFSTAPLAAMPNPGNVIGGHKANLNNPNTSKESKKHSKEVLDREFEGGDTEKFSAAASHGGEPNPRNVEGGLKATISNPNVKPETKERAKERLESEDF